METRQDATLRAFIRTHAVLVFYALVFALLWGPTLILVGPGAHGCRARWEPRWQHSPDPLPRVC